MLSSRRLLIAAAGTLHGAMVSETALGTVIFLHGSGDTGTGISRYLQQAAGGGFAQTMKDAQVTLLTPSAVPRPYLLAGGRVMSVWFDRYELQPSAPEHLESVEASCAQLEEIVDGLVHSGTPASRIAIGGFSMGGGIALQFAARSRHRLAAVFALSSYLCDGAKAYELLSGRRGDAGLPPVFMRHGSADDFIKPAWGQSTAERLAALGANIDFALIPGMDHSLEDGEVESLGKWLLSRLQGPVQSNGLGLGYGATLAALQPPAAEECDERPGRES